MVRAEAKAESPFENQYLVSAICCRICIDLGGLNLMAIAGEEGYAIGIGICVLATHALKFPGPRTKTAFNIAYQCCTIEKEACDAPA